MAEEKKPGPGASVDHLVDENGAVIDVPDDSLLVRTEEVDASVGATSPTAWWRYGLVGLGIVAAILLVLQLVGGNPGTEVVPGTPVAEPATGQPG